MYQELALTELVRLRGQGAGSAAEQLSYHSTFAHWENRASVRRTPRRQLDQPGDDVLYFSPELLPVAGHPLVRDKGPNVVHELLVRHLYDYLDFTMELEQLAVMPVVEKISRGRAGLDLPEQMRADAFKIVTDEAWHAQFSYDLARQVELETAVPQDRSQLPAFIGRLDAVRAQMQPELRGMEGLLFAIVSETLMSSMLADLPRDDRLPSAVRALVRDHAEDEGRHHVYFRDVLRRFWPALSRAERSAVGPLLPEIVQAFLQPDYRQIGRNLCAVGLSAAEAEQALLESMPQNTVAQDMAEAAKAAVRYFVELGVLDDPRSALAFHEAGLVIPV
jgi:hypothetical protein